MWHSGFHESSSDSPASEVSPWDAVQSAVPRRLLRDVRHVGRRLFRVPVPDGDEVCEATASDSWCVMTLEEAKERLTKAARELGETFDAVQIVASWCEEGSTGMSSGGAGNFYARRDMCREFVDGCAQKDLAHEISLALPPQEPPEDSEAWKD